MLMMHTLGDPKEGLPSDFQALLGLLIGPGIPKEEKKNQTLPLKKRLYMFGIHPQLHTN